MRYQITIPPNTPAINPLIAKFQFMHAAIQSERVHIPRGHAYLAGLQVRAGLRLSVFIPEPGSGAEWLVGDGNDVASHYTIVLDPPLYNIELRGYNTDDVYPHTFYVDLD